MRRVALLVLAFSASLSAFAAQGSTNAVPAAASVVAVTNAPATRPQRQQCEAVTKSGNRCKRNAAPGAKLCRQHQKIDAVKAKQ